MTVYEKIRALRIEQGMSQEELAQKVGYSGRGTISKVELSERDISISMLPKYAEALGVTTEYLMSEEPITDDFEEGPELTSRKTMSDRLKEIMKERNLRQVDILNLCQPYCELYNIRLNKSHLCLYLKGSVTPKPDKLMILALALDVNEAWLMGYDVPAERVDSKDSLVLSRLTDEEISLLLAYRKHPEMQNAIKTLLGMTK
ncbi:MAG: helix-turn-helix domain-containing protein [Ruminococcus sp.]|nr:helix-turn-helix domain-containing protein [Ruminococcus sp.]